MEQLHLFPHILVNDCLLENGDWISAPVFCKKKFSEKCQNFYKSIYNAPGPHACPCGLSCYVNIYDGNKVIYTSVRISSFFNRNKTKHILKKEYSPIFTLPVFENVMKMINRINVGLIKESENAAKRKKVDERFVNITVHEVRKLNSHIKAQSEELSKVIDFYPDNLKRIAYLQKNIFATSSLISMRLDAYDFRANPELIEKQKPHEIPIYRIFDKIRHCLRIEQEKENKKIIMTGESKLRVLGHDIFDMLPFVLFDNAIKFSPQEMNIHVTFFEDKNSLTITVTSVGPLLLAGEEKRIFEDFYRGENAKKVAAGSGIGLALAKKICQLHSIDIEAKSRIESKGNLFIVTLVFDPTRLCS